MGLVVKTLKMLGVWALILAVAFLIMEGALRLKDDHDPLAGVRQQEEDSLFKPGAELRSISSVTGEFDTRARINVHGYRGRDFAMPKPDKRLRIFAIGDSFTFGVGSPDDKTIPALFEQDLRETGLDVEVVNAGIGGAGTLQQYANLKHIHLKYAPDAVVLFFDLTDLWDDWYARKHAVYNEARGTMRVDPTFTDGRRDWWITAVYHSRLCRYVHNKIVRPLRKARTLGLRKYLAAALKGQRAKALIAQEGSSDSIEYDGLLFMRGRSREEAIRREWVRTSANLIKIRDLLAERNIPLVIVMYPHGIYVDGDQWRDGRKAWGFEPGRRYDDLLAFEMMADFCKANRILFVNTLDAFLKAPKDKYFFDWDGHMTSKGNVIVASTVAGDARIQALLHSLDSREDSR